MFSSIAVRAEEEAVEADYNTKEITILRDIGVLPDGNEYELDKKVTRAEFADYVAKFFCGIAGEKRKYYKDVSLDYWALDGINYLVEAGYVTVGADAQFNPERTISLAEACKILLSATGYEVAAEANGGYPTGYVNVATSEKIVPPIENMQELKLSEVIKLIYNAADMDIYSRGFTVTGGHYKKQKDETLFAKYHDIYTEDGTATSVYGANLPDSPIAKSGTAYIDNTEYSVGEGVISDDNFAQYSEYVYRDNGDDNLELLYIAPKKQHEEINIPSDNIKEFDASTYALKYYSNSEKTRLKSEDLPRGITVIYNGSQHTEGISTILDSFANGTRRGNLRLIDMDRNGAYDIAVIKSYKAMNIGYINSELTEIYNKANKNETIKTDDYDVVRMFDAEGNETVMTASLPQVISVAASVDKKYLEIITVSETNTGVLGMLDKAEKVIVFDGEEYNLDPQLLNENYKSGEKYSFKVDKFGYVVYFSVDSDSFVAGYLTRIKHTGDDGDILFRVFDEAGKMHEYALAEKVRIDGTPRKTEEPATIFDSIPTSSGLLGLNYTEQDGVYKVTVARQIIRYKLNNEEKIKEIDTFYCDTKREDKETTLRRMLDGNTSYALNWGLQSFELTGVIWDRAKTVCFRVPMPDSNGKIIVNDREIADTDDLYSINENFDHDKKYYLEAYSYDGENMCADVLVNRAEPQKDDYNAIIVDKVSTELNSDDEPITTISGYQSGGAVKMKVDSAVSVSGIKCGDIIRIYKNQALGTITKLTKVFDAETKTFTNAPSTNKNWYICANPAKPSYSDLRNQYFNLINGYANKISGSVMSLSYEYGNTSDLTIMVKAPVVVYNSAEPKNKITVGSLADIMDYEHTGLNCSFVVVPSSSGSPSCIFVYN